MQAKLTLRIDEKLIERAKSHAQKTGKSVSRIVEDYFELLPEDRDKADRPLSPIVSSLRGILRETNTEEDDYRKHLEEKYL